MGLLFIESFDWCSTPSNLYGKFTAGSAAGSLFTAGIAAAAIVNNSSLQNPHYPNGFALELPSGSFLVVAPANATQMDTVATGNLGMRIRRDAATQRGLWQVHDRDTGGGAISDSTFRAGVTWNADGSFSTYSNLGVITGTSPILCPATDRFYHMEWRISFSTSTSATITLYVDGNLAWVSPATKMQTATVGGAGFLRIGYLTWGSINATGPTLYIDDIIWDETANPIGPAKIQVLRPSAVGTLAEWGGADPHLNIDEVQANDTDYIAAPKTDNLRLTFVLPQLAENASILSANMTLYATAGTLASTRAKVNPYTRSPAAAEAEGTTITHISGRFSTGGFQSYASLPLTQLDGLNVSTDFGAGGWEVGLRVDYLA